MEKNSSQRWTTTLATEQDKAQIKSLFAEVFQQEMSEELWQWKYGNGRGAAGLHRPGTARG